MTLRERIADWISGGALTRAQSDVEYWISDRNFIIDQWGKTEEQAGDFAYKAIRLEERLNRIAACETPSANGTVRRMANIAREALK